MPTLPAGSSALAAAKHAWEQRNSNGKNCYDEMGELAECQPPPSFTFVPSPISIIHGAVTLTHPEPDSGSEALVIEQQHVYGVDNPG